MKQVLIGGMVFFSGIILSGCFNEEQAEGEQLPNPEIREQIMAAGEAVQHTNNYEVSIESFLESETQRERLHEIVAAAQIEGAVDNQAHHFFLEGQFSLENLSEDSYLFLMYEPELHDDQYYMNDFFRNQPEQGEVIERDFRVQGFNTEDLEDTVWTDYGEKVDYVVFHDLIDGRLRHYTDENETHHYSNRVLSSMEALASDSQNLEIAEHADSIEITGFLEEYAAEVFDFFWIDAHTYLGDSYRKPLNFTLTLDNETGLPLQMILQTAEEEAHMLLEKNRPLEQDGRHTITFSGYNETTVDLTVPSAEETYFASNGLTRPENVFRNETEIVPLPEIKEAAWESRKIQVYQSILTLPFDVQKLLDLGFTTPRFSEKIEAGNVGQIKLTREGITVNVHIENPGENAVPISQSTAWSISLSQENVESSEVPIYFPGGIALGSFLEDVANTMSEPSLQTLNGGETFHDANELLYVWEEETDDPQSTSLEYSLHPQSKQVFYIFYR